MNLISKGVEGSRGQGVEGRLFSRDISSLPHPFKRTSWASSFFGSCRSDHCRFSHLALWNRYSYLLYSYSMGRENRNSRSRVRSPEICDFRNHGRSPSERVSLPGTRGSYSQHLPKNSKNLNKFNQTRFLLSRPYQ